MCRLEKGDVTIVSKHVLDVLRMQGGKRISIPSKASFFLSICSCFISAAIIVVGFVTTGVVY